MNKDVDEKKTPIVIVEIDEKSRGLLENFLKKFDNLPDFRIEARENSAAHIVMGQDRWSRPVRLGCLVDFLEAQNDRFLDKEIHIGSYNLDVSYRQLRFTDVDQVIDLTDKECEVLIALYQADGHMLSREALLRQVWGYVQALETHTLETHIYRLRQKIESDPSKPSLLVTEGEGYRLVL